MNIKRIVLFTLALYSIGAFSVIATGFAFGDPSPGINPAQSLLDLNSAAQNSIADRTNEKVDQVAQADPSKQSPDKVTAPVESPSTSSPSAVATSSGATSSGSSTSGSTVAATPTTSAQPTAPTPGCGQGGSCTSAQVATHGSRGDCWVMYNSKAYNVTSYVNNHPGGSGSFDSSTCGTDITAQMKGQAGSASSPKKKNHPSSAYNILNSYFVANVSG